MAACLQISLVYTGSSDQTTDAASDLTQDGEIGARNYFFFFPSPLFEVQSRGKKTKNKNTKQKPLMPPCSPFIFNIISC